MPSRLRDIARVMEAMGVRLEQPNSGSHWKLIAANGQTYPIPAHNGVRSEINDIYITKACRALGLDEAQVRERL